MQSVEPAVVSVSASFFSLILMLEVCSLTTTVFSIGLSGITIIASTVSQASRGEGGLEWRESVRAEVTEEDVVVV